jgi:choice-of-anchor B domain-containing protein
MKSQAPPLSIWTLICFFWGFSNPNFAQISPTVNITYKSKISFAGQSGANICGYTQAGREYALVGLSTGTSIVDVTDPVNPVVIVHISALTSKWREIKVYSHYAYITTEAVGQGLQIVDLAGLPTTATPIASLTEKSFTTEGNLVTIQRIHSLHIDENKGFLYAFGGNSIINQGGTQISSEGCTVLNLADPWNPTFAGNLTTPYIHDGFVINDTLYAAHIYAGNVRIYDFTNKTNPVLVRPTSLSTPTTFPHNVWRSDDKKTLFTTDENNDSYLGSFDISNLDDIKLVDKIRSATNGNAIIHNTHVRGNYAITSWYTEGVTIADITRPHNLVQVGQYDLYNGAGNNFQGCWGVYPYLPSGNLIASTLEGELFVLTPTYVRACYLEGTVTDASTNTILSGVLVKINSTDADKQETSSTTGFYATGQVTGGTFSVTYSKAGYQTQTITGIVLSNGTVTLQDVALQPLSLPIELIDFQGFRNSEEIELTWRTALETNINSYEIERSRNGSNWESLFSLKAQNKPSRYTATDKTPTLGTNFYRLKIHHSTGQTEYSKVISMAFEDPSVRQTLVFPNPTHDKIFLFENAFTPQTPVLITDISGKLVRQTTVEVCTNGLVVSDLPKGTYILTIVGGRVPCQRKFVLGN